eukprot:1443101-Pyramimonas_sp.AAC.1
MPSPTTPWRRSARISTPVPHKELQGRPEGLLVLPHRRRAQQCLQRQRQRLPTLCGATCSEFCGAACRQLSGATCPCAGGTTGV